MSGSEIITQEMDFGELVSKTFELYRRDFSKYVILFVVVEAIVGVLSLLVRLAVVLPAIPPANAPPQQLMNWLPGFLGALISLIALTAIISWILYPIAYGGAVKMASEEIEKGQAELVASVRFAISRIVWLWAVGFVVGVIVLLGLVALIIPGIILGIMFSLVIPVIIIESSGFKSLSRSRQLVSHRWLKTFALFIVFGIIIGIASAIVNAITAVFGVASTVVSSILSAFYLPLIPILLTVYYFSNVARIAPPQMGEAPTAPGVMPQAGMKFCPNCGTQLASTTMFCPTCGSKQLA
ncbi:MAG: zinc-ribbon domain-containing protein [Nitrososphaerales archaeon]